MSLLNDVCRCHDCNCEARETCARYAERNTGGDNTPHTETFQNRDGSCDSFIPVHPSYLCAPVVP